MAKLENRYIDTCFIKKTDYIQKNYDYHFHHFYEIFYFISGDADYLVEGIEFHLKPHSLILLPPDTLHSVRINSKSPYKRACIFFYPDDISLEHRNLLLSIFPDNKNLLQTSSIYFENTKKFDIFDAILPVINAHQNKMQKKDDGEELFSIFLENLLAKVYLMAKNTTPKNYAKPIVYAMPEIISYISNNLEKNLSLEELSNKFNISPYTLIRSFKKACGTTVLQYITYKRIVYAKQCMLNGDQAQIAAEKAGFCDYSVFYKAYVKVTGHKPSQKEW